MLIRVGWLDAGTAAGALTGFATFASPQEVEIGPWGHGGHTLADPLRPTASLDAGELSEESQNRRLLDFFATYVQRGEMHQEQRILRYSTLGTSEWHAATSWPPGGLSTRRWYLAPAGRLAEVASPAAVVRYAVDPTASSGEANRWAGNVLGQPVAYPERRAADELLLAYTSDPLIADVHILGFPVVTLRLSTSDTDGAVYIYLEDVGPDGDVTYLAEGQLRLLHRKTAGPPEPAGLGVPRTFARTDSQPVPPESTSTSSSSSSPSPPSSEPATDFGSGWPGMMPHASHGTAPQTRPSPSSSVRTPTWFYLSLKSRCEVSACQAPRVRATLAIWWACGTARSQTSGLTQNAPATERLHDEDWPNPRSRAGCSHSLPRNKR